MEDADIIALYYARSEKAIAETSSKYGAYLNRIARNILSIANDAEEVVSDTYMVAWSTIPPDWPNKLRHYLSRITRNLSFKRLEYYSASKRSCRATVLLDELEECLPGGHSLEEEIEARQIAEILNGFLSKLPGPDVQLFVCRYYYAMKLQDIAEKYGLPKRRIQYRLSVLRTRLRLLLEKEGIVL